MPGLAHTKTTAINFVVSSIGLLTPIRGIILTFKTTTKGLLWASLALGIYVFVLNYNFLYLTGEMPSVEELKNPKLNQSSEIYSQDGVMIGKFYAENRTPIKYENIPKPLINALIATEDARFYEHGGVDPRAIGRAVISFGRDGGGSTITQQLAKNLFKTRRKNQYRYIDPHSIYSKSYL